MRLGNRLATTFGSKPPKTAGCILPVVQSEPRAQDSLRKKFFQLSRAGIKAAKNGPRSDANQELAQRLGKPENPFPLFPPRVTQLFSQPRFEFSIFSHWLPGVDSNHNEPGQKRLWGITPPRSRIRRAQVLSMGNRQNSLLNALSDHRPNADNLVDFPGPNPHFFNAKFAVFIRCASCYI